MRKQQLFASRILSASRRPGVTLSEVLISMLIMSVGVVSLATLFPISVLRSIQASQLTSSTLLFRNAQARLQFDTALLQLTGAPPANTIQKTIIDPFGALVPSLPVTIGGVTRKGLPTTGSLAGDKIAAENLAMLPDSWVMVREDNVAPSPPFTATEITLSAAAADFGDIAPPILSSSPGPVLPPLYRMTIFDATGKLAQRRTLRKVNNSTLSWQDPSGLAEPALPSSFVPSKCRIEVRDSRYTWVMTVRKRALEGNTWIAEVDLVTLFNRSSDPNDEPQYTVAANQTGTGFDSQYGMAGVDDDFDGTTDNASEKGWPGTDDNRTLNFTDSAAFPPPLLKKGGYLMDTAAARWYRVVNLDLANKRILVDKDLYDKVNIQSMVLIKGIVQVYEFGNVTGTQ